MKKKTCSALLTAVAFSLSLVALASCDYWDEEWYKSGGDKQTASASSGSGSSGNTSTDTSTTTTSTDTSTTTSTTPASTTTTTPAATPAASTATAAISGASGTDSLWTSSGSTIACLGAAVGDTLTVAVADGGTAVTTGLTYQWQKVGDAASDTDGDGFPDSDADGDANTMGSTVWVDISGATGASYTITASDVTAPSAMSGSGSTYRVDYRCKVTSGTTVLAADLSQYVRVTFTVP
ncbi:MAG: hypothetical protein ILP18_01820 [Treponema sp.]|nr:hypothetical protein [Treponema sp.]